MPGNGHLHRPSWLSGVRMIGTGDMGIGNTTLPPPCRTADGQARGGVAGRGRPDDAWLAARSPSSKRR
jgi:hypothetical protein